MRVRLVDVADRAGVSRVAAGKVLLGTGGNGVRVGPDAARRIRAAARDLGYSPNTAARQLRGKPSRLISVIMGIGAPPIELDRLAHFERRACAAGFEIAVSAIAGPDPPDSMQAVIDSMSGRGVQGFVVLAPDEGVFRGRLPDTRGIPCAFNGVGSVFARRSTVGMDLRHGGRLIGQHLVKRGRRRIGAAFIGPNVFARERLRGIRETIKRGRATLVGPVFRDDQPSLQKLPAAVADAIAAELVTRGRADALVTENDYWAAAFLKALRRRGARVPDDVAVVGYNNLDLAEYTDPSLTSVEEHNDKIAAALLAQLVRQIEGNAGRAPKRVSVKPSLVVRESS